MRRVALNVWSERKGEHTRFFILNKNGIRVLPTELELAWKGGSVSSAGLSRSLFSKSFQRSRSREATQTAKKWQTSPTPVTTHKSLWSVCVSVCVFMKNFTQWSEREKERLIFTFPKKHNTVSALHVRCVSNFLYYGICLAALTNALSLRFSLSSSSFTSRLKSKSESFIFLSGEHSKHTKNRLTIHVFHTSSKSIRKMF